MQKKDDKVVNKTGYKKAGQRKKDRNRFAKKVQMLNYAACAKNGKPFNYIQLAGMLPISFLAFTLLIGRKLGPKRGLLFFSFWLLASGRQWAKSILLFLTLRLPSRRGFVNPVLHSTRHGTWCNRAVAFESQWMKVVEFNLWQSPSPRDLLASN